MLKLNAECLSHVWSIDSRYLDILPTYYYLILAYDHIVSNSAIEYQATRGSLVFLIEY
jgi:hypothetical protein